MRRCGALCDLASLYLIGIVKARIPAVDYMYHGFVRARRSASCGDGGFGRIGEALSVGVPRAD